ncbi:hypothetical protein RB599_009999 [Gaeumannomyces hyphopodioides]
MSTLTAPSIPCQSRVLLPNPAQAQAQAQSSMFRLYEVDPDADTLLIVPAPSAPFAEWDGSAHHKSSELANGTVSNGHHDASRHQPNGASAHSHSQNGVNAINGISGVNGLANGLSKLSLNGSLSPPLPEMRIKVSSKHLSLASRHFSSKVRHGDHAPIQPDGRVHVRVDDGAVDPSAAVVVMNIIHGRGRKVPRFLDLDALAKVAVFVDRYRCHDAVEAYTDRWVGNLLQQRLDEGGSGLPEVYCRDLVLWIYVSYVFRQPDLFKRATAVAISKSSGPISSLGLPIREKIIRSINNQRQELIIQAVTIIRDALGSDNSIKSPSPTPVCTIGCDSFLRTAFAQSLARSCNITAESSPKALAAGVDFDAIAAAAREVEETHERWHANVGPLFAAALSFSSKPRKRKPSNASQAAAAAATTPAPVPNDPRQPQQHQPDSCVMRMQLTPALRDMEAQIGGLELESSLGYYLY